MNRYNDIYYGPIIQTVCFNASDDCQRVDNRPDIAMIVCMCLVVVCNMLRPIVSLVTDKIDVVMVFCNVFIEVSVLVYSPLQVSKIITYGTIDMYWGMYLYMAAVVMNVCVMLIDVVAHIKECSNNKRMRERHLIEERDQALDEIVLHTRRNSPRRSEASATSDSE